MAYKISFEENKQRFKEARNAVRDYDVQINTIQELRKKQVVIMRQSKRRIFEFAVRAMAQVLEEEYNIVKMHIHYIDQHGTRFECFGNPKDNSTARVLCAFMLKECSLDDVVANKVKLVLRNKQPACLQFSIVPLTVGEEVLINV